MRYLKFSTLLLLSLLGSSISYADTTEGSDKGSSVSKSGYKLVFSTETPTTASSKLTLSDAEKACCNSSFSNQTNLETEWQYCPPNENATWKKRMGSTIAERRQMVDYDNETLKLYAKTVTSATDGTSKFLTGGIQTLSTYKYGIIEIKAKCNAYTGNFPALWLQPEEHRNGDTDVSIWPACGEIDIMEMVNNSYTVYGTLHNANCKCNSGKSGDYSGTCTDADNNYHIYTLVWTADAMTWYFDGSQYYTYSKNKSLSGDDLDAQYPYDKPYFVIVNQSCGVSGGWASAPDEDHTYEMDVAYVRIYQATEESTPYAVTCYTTTGGKVESDLSLAASGSTVTLSNTPCTGYSLDSYSVTDASGNTVEVSDNGTFTMPASNVKVTASFTESTTTETTFALKTSGTIDTNKKYLIAYQAGDDGTEASLMSSSFTSAATSYAHCAPVGETATISSNQITTDETNAFTFESSGTTGSYYIKNNEGTYFGTSSDNAWFDISTSGIAHTVSFNGNKVNLTCSYNSKNLGYSTSAGGTSGNTGFFYGADNSIYLYEEVTSDPTPTPETTLPTGVYALKISGTSLYLDIDQALSSVASDGGYCITMQDVAFPVVLANGTSNGTLTFKSAETTKFMAPQMKSTTDYGWCTISQTDSYDWTVANTGSAYTIARADGKYIGYDSTTDGAGLYCDKASAANFLLEAMYKTNISTSITNGSISTDATYSYSLSGATITLSNTSASGYQLDSYSVTDASGNAVTLNSDGKSFTMPASDVTISATFKKVTTYNVTVNTVTGGTVTASPTTAAAGATVTLSNTPADGYTFSKYTVTDDSGNAVTVNSDGTFTMPASNVTVTANFLKSVTSTTYTISTSTGNLSNNSGNYYSTWTSSSSPTLTLKSYSNSDCSTTAYDITSSLGLYVTKGSTSYFQLSIAEGYNILSYNITYNTSGSRSTSVSVTSGNDNTVNSQTASFSVAYTGNNSNKTVTVSNFTVTVAPIQYTITYDGCDDATNPNPTSYTIEDEITLAAPSKSGYTFTGWTYDGQTTPTTDVTIKSSTGDKSYTANWIESTPTYSITCTATNGSVSASVATAKEGATVTLTVTPNTNYKLSTLSVTDANSTSVETTKNDDGTYSFTMPASNVTVTATFSEIRLDLTDDSPTIKAGTYKAGNVTYTRNVSGQYADFCLPFDADLSTMTGSIQAVYTPAGFAIYNPDTELLTTFYEKQNMSTMEANTPFLAVMTSDNVGEVKFASTTETTYGSTTSDPASKKMDVFDYGYNGGLSVTSTHYSITYGGTLNSQTAVTDYRCPDSTGKWVSVTNLDPFHEYIILKSSSSATSAKSLTVSFTFIDDPTAIKAILLDNAEGNIYDIMGRKIQNANIQNLPKGIYIKGGKKYIVK